MSNILILGAGTWGVAVAKLLNNNGHKVTCWARNKNLIKELIEKHVHPKLLNVILNDDIIFTNEFEKSFENKIEYDYLTKTTNIGIHRDYFLINYNDKDAKTYASEGEKRIIATAIKLALKKDIKNITGEDAILLLDDVFASLDRNKISSLVNYVKNTNQTFISATSLLEVPKELLTNALVIKINNKGD